LSATCDYFRETVTVVHILSVVVANRLLVKIAEQVERLDRNVGAADASSEKARKILDSVCV